MKTTTKTLENFGNLPDSGFVRKAQILSSVLPVSNSTFIRLVENKLFPAPVKITSRCHLWRVADIRAWLDNPPENQHVT